MANETNESNNPEFQEYELLQAFQRKREQDKAEAERLMAMKAADTAKRARGYNTEARSRPKLVAVQSSPQAALNTPRVDERSLAMPASTKRPAEEWLCVRCLEVHTSTYCPNVPDLHKDVGKADDVQQRIIKGWSRQAASWRGQEPVKAVAEHIRAVLDDYTLLEKQQKLLATAVIGASYLLDKASHYPFLLISAPCEGVGKTHLSQLIGNYIHKRSSTGAGSTDAASRSLYALPNVVFFDEVESDKVTDFKLLNKMWEKSLDGSLHTYSCKNGPIVDKQPTTRFIPQAAGLVFGGILKDKAVFRSDSLSRFMHIELVRKDAVPSKDADSIRNTPAEYERVVEWAKTIGCASLTVWANSITGDAYEEARETIGRLAKAKGIKGRRLQAYIGSFTALYLIDTSLGSQLVNWTADALAEARESETDPIEDAFIAVVGGLDKEYKAITYTLSTKAVVVHPEKLFYEIAKIANNGRVKAWEFDEKRVEAFFTAKGIKRDYQMKASTAKAAWDKGGRRAYKLESLAKLLPLDAPVGNDDAP